MKEKKAARGKDKGVVPLVKARATSIFGSKAVGLGDAMRDGLPVPPGVALSGPVVEAIAGEEERAIAKVAKAIRKLPVPLAVRSSAVDEDGKEASFAGQHLTLLNVPSADEVPSALREIWWSANSDSAITYRQRVGLFTRPSVGVVIQSLLDPDVAGVMFTQNPVTGAEECVIEASWGLGEAVVAGLVIPDTYRVDYSGEVLERSLARPVAAPARVRLDARIAGDVEDARARLQKVLRLLDQRQRRNDQQRVEQCQAHQHLAEQQQAHQQVDGYGDQVDQRRAGAGLEDAVPGRDRGRADALA